MPKNLVLKNKNNILAIIAIVVFLTFGATPSAQGSSCPGVPTVTDTDGKVYNTVLIGSQCWLKENMNRGSMVTLCQDGIPRTALAPCNPSSVLRYQNNNGAIEKYCYEDSEANCTASGGLYQWAEAMQLDSSCNTTDCSPQINSPHQGICPSGWHIPTDAEQYTLERFLTDPSVPPNTCDQNRVPITAPLYPEAYDCDTAGNKLKLTGSNASGFSGILNGYTNTPVWGDVDDGQFVNLNSWGGFYSTTQNGANEAWHRHLTSPSSEVYRHSGPKYYSDGVRCISDSAFANSSPVIAISQPDGAGDNVTVGSSYDVTYSLSDPDDVVTAALYYDTDNAGLNGTAIGSCSNVPESAGAICAWNTTGVTPGNYYIYGVTSDGVNPPKSAYSGMITVGTTFEYVITDPADVVLITDSNTTIDIPLTLMAGTSQEVNLSYSSAPAGVTFSWAAGTNPCSPNPDCVPMPGLRIDVPAGTTPGGPYPITITGTSAGLPDHSVTFNLTIVGASQSGNLEGFAWSDTVGWISFSYKDCDTNNNGFIDIGYQGLGYTSAPTVTLTGGGFTTEASATAIVAGGRVVGFNITGGSGYVAAPTVSFSGGVFEVPASATAVIAGGEVVNIMMACGGDDTTNAVIPYGVALDTDTDNLSGYAWSSNIGWISFEAASIAGCPFGVCQPRLDVAEFKGWARACSVFDSGCSGALKPDNQTGGWDGWISLNCFNSGTCATSDHKVSYTDPNLSGWAWGSDVMGWISFDGVSVEFGNNKPILTIFGQMPIDYCRVDLAGAVSLRWDFNDFEDGYGGQNVGGLMTYEIELTRSDGMVCSSGKRTSTSTTLLGSQINNFDSIPDDSGNTDADCAGFIAYGGFTYDWKLRVFDRDNNFNSGSVDGFLSGTAFPVNGPTPAHRFPIANFSVDPDANWIALMPISFDPFFDAAGNPLADPTESFGGTTIAELEWDFDDGEIRPDPVVPIDPASPGDHKTVKNNYDVGIYTVDLRVKDSDNNECWAHDRSNQKTIDIMSNKPKWNEAAP